MLKHEITYEDFNGDKVTETLYFNLSQTEIIDMNLRYQGGLQGLIERITETQDLRTLVEIFKDLLLMSYGVKSEDGKRFVKNDELREQFTQTPAYDLMFMDLATNDDFAAKFITGIVPKDFVKKMEELEKAGKIQNVPLPPRLPGEASKE